MFSNSNNELFPENRTEKIPKTILKNLLPVNLWDSKFHYEAISENSAVLVDEERKGKFTFSDEIVDRVSKEVREKFPSLTLEDIKDNFSKILYRTQSKFHIYPSETVYVDGKKVKVDQIIRDVVHDTEFNDFVIGAEKFKDVPPMEIKISNMPITFKLQQQIFPSGKVQIFDTVNRKILKLKLIVPDDHTSDIQIQFNINLDEADSFEQIIGITPLLTNLIKYGDVKFLGKPIMHDKSILKDLEPVLSNLEIYKMMNVVGEKYDVKFPVKWEITEKELNQLQVLYTSITQDRLFEMPAYNAVIHTNGIDPQYFREVFGKTVNLSETSLEDSLRIVGTNLPPVPMLHIFYRYKVEKDGEGYQLIRTAQSKMLSKVVEDVGEISSAKIANLIQRYTDKKDKV